MRKILRRRNLLHLFLSILLIFTLVYTLTTLPPTEPLSAGSLKIPLIPIFLALTFLFIFFLVSFITSKKAHGFVFASVLTTYLVIRLIGLTHPLFLVLFTGLLVTLELFLAKKK